MATLPLRHIVTLEFSYEITENINIQMMGKEICSILNDGGHHW
jgi:hypothetical protein